MKPLTIDELNALQVGDWVWVVDEDFKDGRYREITIQNEIEPTLFYVSSYSNPAKVYNYSDYGKTWLAYKNKEQAEARGEIVELPCLREHRIPTMHGDIIQKEMVYITKNGYIGTSLYSEDEFEEAERRLADLRGEQ